MSKVTNSIDRKVKAFCAKVGTDPLIVQGAGGNISWKDDNILWIKASGMWLAEAESKEIFVPVNNIYLQEAIENLNFSVIPKVSNQSDLRPSIETLLHALMPHRVVAHLHIVEILAHMIRVNARERIEEIIGEKFNWIFVDYFKPGENLARAVFQELKKKPETDVVFLANHGVVIGGADIDNVAMIIYKLISLLKTETILQVDKRIDIARRLKFISKNYVLCEDMQLNALAINDELIIRLRNDWALYPDHIVFLGEKPNILENSFTKDQLEESLQLQSPFIFVIGHGVYQRMDLKLAQQQQLRCYFDVLIRQQYDQKLHTLDESQKAELINWESETYRKNCKM